MLRVILLSDTNKHIKLSFIMLRVITLGVIYAECGKYAIMLCVLILRVVMLSDANKPVKLSVLMLRVITLSVSSKPILQIAE
jgi:hypothetical protein